MASSPSHRPGRSALSRDLTASDEHEEYIEFFLANMWTWSPSGEKRVLEFFKNLNSPGSTFSFESSLVLRVRCKKQERDFLQRNFLKLQNIIENEITDLRIELDGSLSWADGHADIELPGIISTITTGSRFQGLQIQESAPTAQTMSLDIPDQLSDHAIIVVWQNLQPKTETFTTIFIHASAKREIERAHDVAIVYDFGQKVIFVGASSSEEAEKVKLKLTALLQDFLSSQKSDVINHHVFFVKTSHPFEIDVRDIKDVNPILAPSTILDPWVFGPAEGYRYFVDEDVFCLRVCREEPLRSGHRNRKWSFFGPRVNGVPGIREPSFASRLFRNMRVPNRPAPLQPSNEGVNVIDWRNGVATGFAATSGLGFTGLHGRPHSPTQPVDVPSSSDHIALISLDDSLPSPVNEEPLIELDENGPIQIPSDQSACHYSAVKPTVHGTHSSILDQDDQFIQDPLSTMPRAMLPAKRRIEVQHPDLIPAMFVPPYTAMVEGRTELDRLCAALKYQMAPLRSRWGVVGLRAEVGRYYALGVAPSGRASNGHNEPANGWQPEHLRSQLESGQLSFFTRAITSWGSDVDFFKTLKIAGTQLSKWEPSFGTSFLDFRFQARPLQVHGQDAGVVDMVLEVDTRDYSWTIRELENTNGLVYCHCLDHHWDFQLRVSHDCILEHRERWDRFAQELINSLDVSSPNLRFQHSFRDASLADCPIFIHSVKIRQVVRAQHQTQGLFLDITRVMPTEVVEEIRDRHRLVRTLQRDNLQTGTFSQWFEASISSARIEELMKQNEKLVPGDQAEWSVEQLQEEGLFKELANEVFSLVREIDGVGVACNNGHASRSSTRLTKKFMW